MSLYLTSREAAALVVRLPDVLLIDVRPVAEVERVGLPEAVHRNVPLLVADPPSGRGAVRQNERFVQSVEDFAGGPVLARRRTIVLICVSGVHSAQASDLLAEAGFERVYSVVDGYDGDTTVEATKGDAPQKALNGWRALALPWRDRPRSDQAWPTSP